METNDLPVKGIDEHGQNLIDWAPLGYQALDADGRFLMVNEAWLETLGYRREEVIGKWFGDFLAGEYVEAFRQRFALFKAAGKIHSEFEMLHKSGQRRFIAFDGRIERQPEGGFGKTHCILQDITERKRAEEELRKSEKRFRLLVESAPEAIFVQTHQRFAYVNEATLRLFGGKVPGDLLGQLLESRFHPDIRQIIRERTRIINEEKLPVPRLEEMVLRLDGTLVPVEASAVPIHYEGIDGGLSFLRDITQRKQAEEKLRRQTNVTEAINRVLQASIQATRDEEVGRICLTAAEELTRSQFGWIGEINPMGRLDTIAMSNPGWEACRIPGIKWSAIRNMEIRGIFGRVIKDGNSLIANEPGTHPDRVGLPSGHPELTAFLGVPLKQDGRTIGMVALANKPLVYSEQDREAIEALSVAFVEALQRKRADDRVRDQLEELQRWQEVMLGREDRVQELKREVNELCRRLGEAMPYPSQETDSAVSEKREPKP